MTDRVLTVTVEVTDPTRLDKYLAGKNPEFSRTRYQELIRSGKVKIDGDAIIKPGHLVEDGGEIVVEIPAITPSEIIPENIPLDIIFENDDVVVVNKSAGMVVHPSPGYASGTLVNAVLFHAPEMIGVGGVHRPGLVHRLDKDTSGVIILAKNDLAHRHLQDQFRARTVRKTYIALVDGRPPTPEGRIETAIDRDNRNRKRMAVVPKNRGRAAVTEYTTVQEFPRHTLLHAHPLTGRTHQIRVHLAYLGCPVVGDGLYGFKKTTLKIKRQFLHAHRLEIVLPGEETPRIFESSLAPHLSHVLKNLKYSAFR